jgi:hypothetical protein
MTFVEISKPVGIAECNLEYYGGDGGWTTDQKLKLAAEIIAGAALLWQIVQFLLTH